MSDKPTQPFGYFSGPDEKRFVTTGEFRTPKRGEYYYSPTTVQAFCAVVDFQSHKQHWIAVEKCPK